MFLDLYSLCFNARTSWCTCWGSSCSTSEICRPRRHTSSSTTWWSNRLISLFVIQFSLDSQLKISKSLPPRWDWSCTLCGPRASGEWTPSRPRWPSCGRWSATWRGCSSRTSSRPWRRSSVRWSCWSRRPCQVSLTVTQLDNITVCFMFLYCNVTPIICQMYFNVFWCFVVAGTKTLVVHGQNECDIPTQLPVHEDTQFEALLKASQRILN